MPWRGEKDPYKVWLSEVMLQQTQVETVKPYYKKWLERFPTPSHVATATEDEVLKLWEGLGYYARARNFKKACEWIHEQNAGKVPKESQQFKNLKGVGDYIHAAVRSIVFNEVIPVIDGNVKRVVSRIIELNSPPSKSISTIRQFLDSQISSDCPGDFNQAIMDLGSTVCKPRNPKCNECKLSSNCASYMNNTVDKYPLPEKKKSIPHYDIAVGIIWRDNQILIAKRPADVMLGGLWEFPGGKCGLNEELAICVKREIKEELDIEVSVEEKLKSIKHAYTHFTIELTPFHCQFLEGTPKNLGCVDHRWINPSEIEDYPFPKANHKFFNQIPESNPCTYSV